MLDNVLNLVKNTISGAISTNSAIPEAKKQQTVETATQAIGEGLQENINLGNMSNIMSLFKNNGQSATSNPIVSNIVGKVINALVQKVGLSEGVANSFASTIVPMVMGAISGKVNDPNEKGFNVESLISSFTGSLNSADGQGSHNGILNSIGKLFGK